jgi:hypothetical protein
MKYVLSALILTCALITPASGQADFSRLIMKGDADALAALFDDPVELRILDSDNALRRDAATQHLEDFFNSHQVQTYEEKHSGASKSSDTSYSIGQMTTDKGVFRVFILYEVQNSKYLIREFRIEDKS